MSETDPTPAQIDFCYRWLFLDMREAFPELPLEVIEQAAWNSAESTARALNEAESATTNGDDDGTAG